MRFSGIILENTVKTKYMKSRKLIIYIIIIIIAVLICTSLICYFFKDQINVFLSPSKQNRTMQDVINDLTAPESVEKKEISNQTIDNLSAPSSQLKEFEAIPEEIFKSLSAP